jgi:hypothetical protein
MRESPVFCNAVSAEPAPTLICVYLSHIFEALIKDLLNVSSKITSTLNSKQALYFLFDFHLYLFINVSNSYLRCQTYIVLISMRNGTANLNILYNEINDSKIQNHF